MQKTKPLYVPVITFIWFSSFVTTKSFVYVF